MFEPHNAVACQPATGPDCPGACNSSASDLTVKKRPSRSLRSIFKKCALCAGSGAGGFLAGHAGCIVTPLVIAAAGATAATAGVSALALAFSAAATVGGLFLWRKLRGGHAGKLEKRIVVGSAVTGLLLSSAFNLATGHHHHHRMAAPSAISEPYCGHRPDATFAPDAPIYPPASTHQLHQM